MQPLPGAEATAAAFECVHPAKCEADWDGNSSPGWVTGSARPVRWQSRPSSRAAGAGLRHPAMTAHDFLCENSMPKHRSIS
jgi:hypothetical protein